MTLSDFPNELPALTLDFLNSRQLDPRINFSRASDATTTPPTTGEGTGNVNGEVYTFQENVPRLTDQGLLIEEARTNLAVGTINMKANWERTINSNLMATITNNAAIGPDGTMSANLITPEYTTGSSYVDVVQGNANPYSVSCYLKDNGAGNVRIYYQSIFNAYCDLTTGEVTDEWGNPQPPLVDVGNGWWYFQRTAAAGYGNPGTSRKLFLELIDNSADSVKGFYVYGMQFEQGSFSTSWIGTPVGGTATRAADTAEMPAAGVYNPAQNTIINQDFGVAGGSDTLTIVGNGTTPAKRTAVYNGHLTQERANTLAGKDDEWWEWRVVGSPFGWRKRMTEGSIDVDWGDGSPIEGLPIDSSHDFIDGAGYHTVRLRLGTAPYIGFDYNTADFKLQVLSIGPIPASMQVYGFNLFNDYTNLKTVDFAGASFMSPSAYGNRGFDGMFGNCSSLLSIPDIKKDSSVTRVGGMFNGCNSLTRLPLFDTSNIGSFGAFAKNCNNLKEVPLYDTSSANDIREAFFSCTQLTSFPLLNTSGVTNFNQTWWNCVSLASFPKIDTSSGNDFYRSWCLCTSLVSFPELDFSSGTTFKEAWYQCSALTDFEPAMFHDPTTGNPTTGTLAANAFQNAWRNCALTAQSIENILVSLDANGATEIQLGIQGGSNAAKTTWSTAANDAYTNLIDKDWDINFNP